MRVIIVEPYLERGVQMVRLTDSAGIYAVEEKALPPWCKGKTRALLFVFEYFIRPWQGFDLVHLIDSDIWKPERTDLFYKQFEDDETLGVLCANRNFFRTDTLANAIRNVWGNGAALAMTALDIPWGGYMAFRASLIPDFIELWSDHIFDDTAGAMIARKRGLTFRYSKHPRDCYDASGTTFPEFWNFVLRQYADVREIGPWGGLLALWSALLFSTIAVYLVAPMLALPIYFGCWLFLSGDLTLRTMLAVPINQLLFLVAIPRVAFLRRIRWGALTLDLKTKTIV